LLITDPNNRLDQIMKRVNDDVRPGASGMCKFFSETEEDEEDVCESIEFERQP